MTTASPLEQLVARARGPLGPRINPDLGRTDGPLSELAALLSQVNGFTVFNGGVQVFHAGPRGLGPELQHWNALGTWKDSYRGRAEGLFCFAQDLLGSRCQRNTRHDEGFVLGRPAISVEVQRSFWKWIRKGEIIDVAAAAVGVSKSVGWRWFREAGGVMPPQRREPSSRPVRLSFAEREEIACRRAADEGVRAIARAIGRSPSTVSRELARGIRRPKTGYRATVAQALADTRTRRPKIALLRRDTRLRAYVEQQLVLKHSPEQISQRLLIDFPDDLEMRVSHETIYQSLYVQGRGALKRELAQCLRTGRALRRPHRKPDERRSRHAGAVSISERPAEVEDRSVPGHWEGDLITGAGNGSAIGTLVERVTGFVMLLHLPNTHKALDVQEAMTTTMSRLPRTLRRTLTWDQGQEMANHIQIAAATDLDIYFCDPHSPWQRGTNENTNGLLRQYFPKFTDLSGYHPDYLEFVAAELNNRPRKRLGWRSPAEALDRLLSQPDGNPPGVALAS